MIWEALRAHPDERPDDEPIAVRELLVLGVATSIDALAVGISFAFLEVSIVGRGHRHRCHHLRRLAGRGVPRTPGRHPLPRPGRGRGRPDPDPHRPADPARPHRRLVSSAAAVGRSLRPARFESSRHSYADTPCNFCLTVDRSRPRFESDLPVMQVTSASSRGEEPMNRRTHARSGTPAADADRHHAHVGGPGRHRPRGASPRPPPRHTRDTATSCSTPRRPPALGTTPRSRRVRPRSRPPSRPRAWR